VKVLRTVTLLSSGRFAQFKPLFGADSGQITGLN
jgi:hypothetical protein